MSNRNKRGAMASADAARFIDARHSALFAIRHARQRFEDVANRIEGIVWEADPATLRIIYVSAQLERLLGYRQNEFLADGFWEAHLHPQDRERVKRARKAATEPDLDHVQEYRMLASDGRVVWLRDSFSLSCTDPVGLLRGVMTECRHRTRAEDEMRLFDILLHHCGDGVILTDTVSRIVQANVSFCAVSGYEQQDLIGKTPAMLRSGMQDAGFYRAMWDAISCSGQWTGQLWNRRKSGELYLQHLSIVSVKNDGGTLCNYLGIARDISQSRALQTQVAWLSSFDPMTGLPNRALLREQLTLAITSAQRSQRRVAVLAIDLDRLTDINDTLGHEIGDQVLVTAAKRLRAAVHPAQCVARHIGDEFTVVLENVDTSEDIANAAEQLLQELSAPYRLAGYEISIGACIGISQFPHDGNSPEMLLKNANVALHDAKAHGTAAYQFFREEMHRASMQQLRIESSLKNALLRNEMHVFYQPQVELASGRISGMEALLRWSHAELGVVSPAQFIQIAEKTGDIIDIGLWVTAQACAQTCSWHNMHHPDLCVAVNVSACQLARDDFPLQIKQILDRTGMRPEKLELELTESMIMQKPERVINILQELRAIGVRFSIDDFGTGYSSLSQLKRFPIDRLKIDQSFTRDIGDDKNGAVIARTIITLGHGMGLHVIAEGVETEAQRRFLVESGCHGMQGYLFSRPIPASEFSALLREQSGSAAGSDSMGKEIQ